MDVERIEPSSFMLCDYFNDQGRRVERIYIATDNSADAVQNLRDNFRNCNHERLLDGTMAEALGSDAATDLCDAALALHTLLHEVADEQMPLAEAREIVAIGVNFRRSVTIAEIIPALETEFGGFAVSWARGIFRHLNLGTPEIH